MHAVLQLLCDNRETLIVCHTFELRPLHLVHISGLAGCDLSFMRSWKSNILVQLRPSRQSLVLARRIIDGLEEVLEAAAEGIRVLNSMAGTRTLTESALSTKK